MKPTSLCPVCGGVICPSLFECIPRRWGYRQYKCEHCSTWLSLSGWTKFKLVVAATIGCIAFAIGIDYVGKALLATGYISTPPLPAQYALYAIYGIAFTFGLARFTQQIAKWVPAPQ